MSNTKINPYIHFAVRANKVLWGLDVIKSSSIVPKVILFDETLGKNSKKQMTLYSDIKKVKVFELEENYLNDLLKRTNIKIIGIIDESLANQIIEIMSKLED